MITRLQTRNFRSLKAVDQKLEGFHALVGPNASGKTTFLDAIAFFGDLFASGIQPISARIPAASGSFAGRVRWAMKYRGYS